MLTLLAAAMLFAAQADPLEPIAWLLGPCWYNRNDPDGESRLCYERMPNGEIHGRLEEIKDGEATELAETRYRWDADAQVIRYIVDRPGTANDVIGIARADGGTIDMGEIIVRGRHLDWTQVRTDEDRFESRIDLRDGDGPQPTSVFIREE